jgi:hypothetical protein
MRSTRIRIRRSLYHHIDSMVDGLVSTVVVVGGVTVAMAVLKAAILYLIR